MGRKTSQEEADAGAAGRGAGAGEEEGAVPAPKRRRLGRKTSLEEEPVEAEVAQAGEARAQRRRLGRKTSQEEADTGGGACKISSC